MIRDDFVDAVVRFLSEIEQSKTRSSDTKVLNVHPSPEFLALGSFPSEICVAHFLVKAGIIIEIGRIIRFYF